MEESEKRRERLKAMRMEAAEADASDIAVDSTAPGYLSNPLIEPSAIPPVKESSPAVPRFDFYTDPMAAFSGNKRNSSSSSMQTPQNYVSPTSSSGSPMTRFSPSLSGPRNLDIIPFPAHQYHSNYSPNNYNPNQRAYEASMGYSGSDSWRSPVGIASPFPGHQRTPPGVWNRSGGRAGYPFHSPRGGGFLSPGLGLGSPSPGLGRGGSPSPSFGRGSSHQFSNSPRPGSGRGGGRGRGFHGVASARENPDMFYNRTMVEDPWMHLTPVVRISVLPANTQRTPESLTSWLPKSIGLKRARVSEAVIEFNSQSSLAECLAASFEEAANDATDI
ncbi:hypothetical protein NE237_023030 [Protea cynaroides]|uniref:Uncharacterized protein n=1 Tax=Protea cynaroides TaxID=273540 RepID=A0A9Q0K4R6_9MAGN|nr:hypothetical protein NE237_023030 [Protea cynaroides]